MTEPITIGKHSGSLELRLFPNDIVRIYAIAHPRHLLMSL